MCKLVCIKYWLLSLLLSENIAVTAHGNFINYIISINLSSQAIVDFVCFFSATDVFFTTIYKLQNNASALT